MIAGRLFYFQLLFEANPRSKESLPLSRTSLSNLHPSFLFLSLNPRERGKGGFSAILTLPPLPISLSLSLFLQSPLPSCMNEREGIPKGPSPLLSPQCTNLPPFPLHNTQKFCLSRKLCSTFFSSPLRDPSSMCTSKNSLSIFANIGFSSFCRSGPDTTNAFAQKSSFLFFSSIDLSVESGRGKGDFS